MAVEIPLISTNPYYTARIKLENSVFNLVVFWSTREQAWYLTIKNSQNDAILINLKLLPFVNLTGRFEKIQLPDGAFICFAISGDDPPTRDDLGSRIKVWFLTEQDLEFVFTSI